MGAPFRRSTRSVAQRLFAEPHRFEFYQAVRILEQLRPQCVPLGEGVEPQREAVSFASDPGFAFPPSDIRALTPSEEDAALPPRMEVTFIGLAGARGPLPNAATEVLLQRARHRDTAFRDFLDLFNHRIVSLMYRVRRHTRLSLGTEPPEQTRFARYLEAFLGLGTPNLRGRLGAPDRALLRYVGLLAGRARSAPGLEILLADYFAVAVRVQSFVGCHLVLDEEERTAIGRYDRGRNNALGQSVVVGARVWDRQSRFAVHMGPLTFSQFLAFLPIGGAHGVAAALTRFYVGEHLDFDIRLILRPDEVPQARLGRQDGSRLGWTSWLRRQPGDTRPGLVRLAARRDGTP